MNSDEIKTPPEEFKVPPKEYRNPPEFYEYAGGDGGKGRKKKKTSSFFSLIRTQAIMPIAAAIASVSVIAASFGTNIFAALGISDTDSSSSSHTVTPVDSYILAEYELPSEKGYYDGTNVVKTLLYAADGVEVKDANGDTLTTGKLEGASYDESTNTLRLNDVLCDYILLSGMGSMTVSVGGTYSNIGRIEAKGGGSECSIRIVPESGGTPSLDLSPRTPGFPAIALYADGSASTLTFGNGLSVFIYAENAAAVYGTTAPEGIVLEGELKLELGKLSKKKYTDLCDFILEGTGDDSNPVAIESK